MAMKGFQKAKREKIWVKVLLGGPSGSGKSYSALRMATGIASKYDGRFAVIDTEAGRIRYYANEFDFDDLQLEAPYKPEKYIEAIDMAVEAGYKCLVIDSMSHEWVYITTEHDKMPGNSFTNWRYFTPRHDAFMEKILQSPIHIIATARGNDQYVQDEKDGKKTVTKQGVGYTLRKDTEYNYTATFNLSQDSNLAMCMKDNTHIFEGKYDKLTEKDGVALYDWANSGEGEMPKFEKTTDDHVEAMGSLSTTIEAITAEFRNKMDLGVDKTKMYDEIAKVNGGKKSWTAIKDIDKAKEILELVKSFE